MALTVMALKDLTSTLGARFQSSSVASAVAAMSLCSSKADQRKNRSLLFTAEKERQKNLLTKIHKIEVEVVGLPQSQTSTLMMNKNVSTPYDCALHINKSLTMYPAVAMVNDLVWDINKPLENDCQLRFLHYTEAKPHEVNKAYWRSCSFLLGSLLETAFKDNFKVILHSWPNSDYRSGSFVYDAFLDVDDWTPSQAELKMLGKVALQEVRSKNLRFEPLEVDVAVAERIFEHNHFKLEQLKSISKKSRKINLYRLGDHVDISSGPMITSTGQFGIFSVTAFHKYQSSKFGTLHRVQGVSVPFTQFVNSWTWEIVTKAAKSQNMSPLPSEARYDL